MRRILTLVLGVLLLCFELHAQTRTITGRVTDETGSAVPNASVVLKGNTAVGTTTDEQGNFSLTVPSNAQAIIVSSVGQGTKEIALTTATNYAVSLDPRSQDMQEVVVVAYGTQKRADLTGAIGTVKADDIENKPFTSVDKALQGAVSGLFSAATSGAPGSNQTIRIRGISSINAGNSPLWVLDGVIVNTGDASRLTTTANLLSTLNPNDIESISVLKDAAATSIYGSQGANGVILITTKKGRAGKTKFRFDTEIGQSDIAYYNDKYKPLNADQYFEITKEGLVNLGYTPTQADAIMGANFGFGNNVDFDWFDAVTQKGSHQQYNLSASGGNDKTTFFLSGGFFNQEGTIIKSNLKRTTGNINVTNKATDRLTFRVNLNGGFVNQRTPLSGGAFGNPILSSLFILPSRAARNPDGSLNITAPDFGPGSLHNTIATTELDKRHLKQTSLRGSVNGEYSILRNDMNNLKFTTNFGGDYNILEEDQYNNPFHGDGRNTQGRAFAYFTRYFKWTWTNYLDYHRALNRNDDLGLDLKVGYESSLSKGYFSSLQSQGFPPTTDLQFPTVGATPITASASFSDNSIASAFSNATLNFKDRYVLYGSFRRDGSSRFGYDTKYGNFWSLGLSWNVDNEAFMQSMDVISQLKLRASYGKTGNNQIGNYDWQPSYGYGSNYNQLPGSAPSQVGDSSLTWEESYPFNVGIDVGVLKNRITLSADYFVRTAEKMLLGVQLSRTTGFAGATRNIGEMENKGVELNLHAVPVTNRNFNWNIDWNLTHVKNKVTSLPDGNDIPNGVFQIREGYDVQTYFVRVYAGVDPANGDPLWYTDSSQKNTTNVYNSAQRVMYGSASPKVFGSFTNAFNFKGFTLEAQFNYTFGNLIRDTWGSYYNGAGFGGAFNKVVRVMDRWQQPGDVTDVPKYIYNGNKNAHSFSTRYLFEGDYIRLRNLQLGYDIPNSVLNKTKVLSSAFFYVRGANLWTWVKDEDLPWDPENGIGSQTNMEVFIPKTITVGLNVGF